MALPHRGLKEIHTGRDFERLISFSDGVVAVAITVLVLAIVDIQPTADEATTWQLLSDNSGQIFTFFFTFLVVGIMWLAHNRVLNQLRGFDGLTFWLNLFWLAGICFLPWPSSLYGESFAWGGDSNEATHGGGSGVLYWSTLALVSGLAFVMAWHAQHSPGLLEPKVREAKLRAGGAAHYRGLVFAVIFLMIAVVSAFSQAIASYLPILLIPASIFARSSSPLNDVVEDADS